jgi:hypothetical protein
MLGTPGAFVTSGKLMAAPGSDFDEVPNRRVMDRACTVARAALVRWKREKLRVDARTGFLLEADARRVERFVATRVRAALLPDEHASAVDVQAIRTDNLLTTQQLRVRIQVVPVAYARTIVATIGFRNPALESVQ